MAKTSTKEFKRSRSRVNRNRAQRALDQIQRASRIIAARMRLELKEYGITDSELSALTLLLENERMSIGELGRELVLTTGARTYLVNRLEKAGYARREGWKEDGRFYLVELTPKGKAFIEKLLVERGRLTPAYLKNLGANEQAELCKLLGRLCDAADEYERPGRVQ